MLSSQYNCTYLITRYFKFAFLSILTVTAYFNFTLSDDLKKFRVFYLTIGQ